MDTPLTRRSFPLASLAVFTTIGLSNAVALAEEQDLAAEDPKNLGFAFVPTRTEEATGFVIGGKNETAKIRKLASLNGRSIAELEKVMRPDSNFPQGSTEGFLGENESLLEVLAADNETVIGKMKQSHAGLARPLLVMGYYAGQHAAAKPITLIYNKRTYLASVELSRGYQLSPFQDGTASNTDIHLQSLDSQKTITYSLLVPHMIERYGFYEGTGTPYRVDPQAIAKVLGLL